MSEPTRNPEWTMPTPPADGCKPYADLVASTWDLFWATPEQIEQGTTYCGADGNMVTIGWPFGDFDDNVTGDDLRALGFLLVDGAE